MEKKINKKKLSNKDLTAYSHTMSNTTTVFVVSGYSAIDGRVLFLGAGRDKNSALASAYGRVERLHRGHCCEKFESVEAALAAYPSFEESIMCEL